MKTDAPPPRPSYWLRAQDGTLSGPFMKSEAGRQVDESPPGWFQCCRDGEDFWQDAAERLNPKRQPSDIDATTVIGALSLAGAVGLAVGAANDVSAGLVVGSIIFIVAFLGLHHISHIDDPSRVAVVSAEAHPTAWLTTLGGFMLVIGILVVLYFGLFFDTGVTVGEGAKVVNLGFMNDRLVGVIAGVGMAITGAILIGFGSRKTAV